MPTSENHTLKIKYTALLLKLLTSLCENSTKGRHVQNCVQSRTGACDVSCRQNHAVVVRVSFCNYTDFKKSVCFISGEKKTNRSEISL